MTANFFLLNKGKKDNNKEYFYIITQKAGELVVDFKSLTDVIEKNELFVPMNSTMDSISLAKMKQLGHFCELKNEQVLFSMAYQSLRKRVALALYDLAITYGKESQETVVIRLSREDLASRVGTATESVIRTLSEFKKEGLLEIKGGEMTILDVAGLKDLKY